MPRVSELLAAWEAGLAAGETRRALLLHALARPDASVEELLAAPVGERDADLFALRGALFGPRLDVWLACAECAEEMEFDLDVAALVAAGRPDPGPHRVEAGPWAVRFRLPTAGDLAAVTEAAAEADPRLALLGRCVLEATRDGATVDVAGLPAEVTERLAAKAAEVDPGADITLNVPCPECGHATKAELDIATYLWAELDAWARSTLLDVHLLASAYGWSEPEILALSPVRRRYYLELLGDA
ncbi:hypothetical protein C3Y87_00965 [Carbonactinospora thermoautotrophica]|uniref:T4 family baseplate hub assembly chaperone n=1 Tax=Carbonactinospora thermoautotrophica TaxID=1469144 RepID=UPI0022712D51|nr:hypothetical protein [Carbonactinospora thermoautotrophica]MCX9190008.1 hypothetical protein [Carbonactinospora thermoautotrophica]